MAELLRRRMIRPDTRKAGSTSYKVNTAGVGLNDSLRVEITHAGKTARWVYTLTGAQIGHRKSIHFTVKETAGKTEINWGKLLPRAGKPVASASKPVQSKIYATKSNVRIPGSMKRSFLPVVDGKTEIIILGTLPGDESLRMQQYYANQGNQFWRILSGIWNEPVPAQYPDKIKWLLQHRLGLWDVCHSASRKGSLDQQISNEVPNDLHKLFRKYPKISRVLFNGLKARKTYDKYFRETEGFIYGTLISSSGAAAKPIDQKMKQWRKYLEKWEVEHE